jgi:hypothetical protein
MEIGMPVDTASEGVPRGDTTLNDRILPVWPVFLAGLTAVMYFVLTRTQATYLGGFGLSPSTFSSNLAAMAADDLYALLVLSLIMTIALVGNRLIIGDRIVGFFDSHASKLGDWATRGNTRRRGTFAVSVMALPVLAMGVLTPIADTYGRSKADTVRQSLLTSCISSCFSLRSTKMAKPVIGPIVAQDSTKIAILTSTGLRLYQWSEVETLSPFRGQPAQAKAAK